LRTPLTRIRAELEVDAAHPTNADLAATRHSVLEETIALQRLVDDLLYLARSDGSSHATSRSVTAGASFSIRAIRARASS